MSSSDLLSIPSSNPNLPPKIKDAREMFKYAAIFFLIAALINGLWGIWDIFRGLLSGLFWWGTYYSGFRIFYGIFRIVLAVVAIIIKGKFVENIITPIDQGRYQESKDNMIVYMILGFIFGLVLSGLLILLGYMKMDEVDFQAKNCPDCRSSLRYVQQYDNWYCDTCGDYKVPVHAAESSPTPPPGQQPQQQPPEQTPPPGQQSQQQQQTQQPQQPQQQQQQQPPPSTQQQPPQQQQQQQENQCPDCSGEMRHIDEYDRWYCDNCQEYK